MKKIFIKLSNNKVYYITLFVLCEIKKIMNFWDIFNSKFNIFNLLSKSYNGILLKIVFFLSRSITTN